MRRYLLKVKRTLVRVEEQELSALLCIAEQVQGEELIIATAVAESGESYLYFKPRREFNA